MAGQKVTPGIEEKSIIEDRKNGPVNGWMKKPSFKRPGWFNDETTWPQDRGLEVFRRWFDFRYHPVLVDLCDGPLVLEL
jgi:hypothetical protein